MRLSELRKVFAIILQKSNLHFRIFSIFSKNIYIYIYLYIYLAINTSNKNILYKAYFKNARRNSALFNVYSKKSYLN